MQSSSNPAPEVQRAVVSRVRRGRTGGLLDAKAFELAIRAKRTQEGLPLLERDEIRSCAIIVSTWEAGFVTGSKDEP